jgi:cbb3-type cytochrome oxidase subunit 3
LFSFVTFFFVLFVGFVFFVVESRRRVQRDTEMRPLSVFLRTADNGQRDQ